MLTQQASHTFTQSRFPPLLSRNDQIRTIKVPDKPDKFGPFLGLRIEEGTARATRRDKNDKGDSSRWSIVPTRPRLAPCVEFRLSSLRVVIPGREGYERDLIRSLGEDVPDQVCTPTHRNEGEDGPRRMLASASTDFSSQYWRRDGGYLVAVTLWQVPCS